MHVSAAPRRELPGLKPGVAQRILDAAERLFGRQGMEAVSLRQIAAAAGSANPSVVQYHFGDKATLVRAIFERRLPSLEARRAQLLEQAGGIARLDARALLDILLSPIAEEKDIEGRRSYGAFLLGLRMTRGLGGPRRAAAGLAPLTSQVVALLQDVSPHLSPALRQRRLLAASDSYLVTLAEIDSQVMSGEPPMFSEKELLTDALEVATAIMTAPAGRCS